MSFYCECSNYQYFYLSACFMVNYCPIMFLNYSLKGGKRMGIDNMYRLIYGINYSYLPFFSRTDVKQTPFLCLHRPSIKNLKLHAHKLCACKNDHILNQNIDSLNMMCDRLNNIAANNLLLLSSSNYSICIISVLGIYLTPHRSSII